MRGVRGPGADAGVGYLRLGCIKIGTHWCIKRYQTSGSCKGLEGEIVSAWCVDSQISTAGKELMDITRGCQTRRECRE